MFRSASRSPGYGELVSKMSQSRPVGYDDRGMRSARPGSFLRGAEHVSERDTKRDAPPEPADGRDIPRGTDEHADSEPTPRERGASKSAPKEPDQGRGRDER